MKRLRSNDNSLVYLNAGLEEISRLKLTALFIISQLRQNYPFKSDLTSKMATFKAR